METNKIRLFQYYRLINYYFTYLLYYFYKKRKSLIRTKKGKLISEGLTFYTINYSIFTHYQVMNFIKITISSIEI